MAPEDAVTRLLDQTMEQGSESGSGGGGGDTHDEGAVKKNEVAAQSECIEQKPQQGVLLSVKELSDLHSALSDFLRRWHDLQDTFSSLASSIASRSRELDAAALNDKNHAAKKPNSDSGDGGAPPEDAGVLFDRYTELRSLCQSMVGRNFRKFVAAHLSDLDWLRASVPRALASSSNPAKLVLNSMGRFYLQGRKAFSRPADDPMVVGRRAGILILEFYLLSGCCGLELEDSVKDHARAAALSWKNRLDAEGGVQNASPADALGLLLFVGAFGIPQEFGCTVLSHLLRLCNLKNKARVLWQSSMIREKISDVIDDLLSKDMHVDAINIICAFDELRDIYSPGSLLSSFLEKQMGTQNLEQERGQSSLRSQIEVWENQLIKLKSVANCMENNKLDCSEFASFDVNQKINELENNLARYEQQLRNNNLKRTALEMGPLGKQDDYLKRHRPLYSEASMGLSPRVIRQSAEQQGVASANTNGLYGSFSSRNVINGLTGLHNQNSISFLTPFMQKPARPGSESGTVDANGLTVARHFGSSTNFTRSLCDLHGNGELNEGIGLLRRVPFPQHMDPVPAPGETVFYAHSETAAEVGSSSRNLYQFANTVVQRESYYTNPGTNDAGTSLIKQRYFSQFDS